MPVKVPYLRCFHAHQTHKYSASSGKLCRASPPITCVVIYWHSVSSMCWCDSSDAVSMWNCGLPWLHEPSRSDRLAGSAYRRSVHPQQVLSHRLGLNIHGGLELESLTLSIPHTHTGIHFQEDGTHHLAYRDQDWTLFAYGDSIRKHVRMWRCGPGSGVRGERRLAYVKEPVA